MAKHKQSNNLATAEIIAKLGRLEALLAGDMSDIMRGIAGILEDDVEAAFENEWNPSTHKKWTHLDAATIKQRKAKGKWPGDILRVEGNLASRVTSDYGSKFSRVGVKSAGVDDYAPAMQFFLNHLCGGQHLYSAKSDWGMFLNHLCGGEPNNTKPLTKKQFLNHLCGGERWVKPRLRLITFLNHLCGGERTFKGQTIISEFLNHLCGGERGGLRVGTPLTFLNHLCGGER